MIRDAQRLAVLLVLSMGLVPIAMGQGHQKNRMNVRKGELLRGNGPFTMRAVATPGLFTPGVTDAAIVKTLAAVSDAGANTVLFELGGFGPSGETLSEARVETVDRVMGEINYRRLSAICRLFPEDSPRDPAYRKAAVRTAARALKKAYSLVYWIGGPDSASLARLLTKQAPRLLVASREGGAIDVVTRLAEVHEGTPALLVDAIPQPLPSKVHSVLLDPVAGLAQYESALSHPIEKQPWFPTTEGLTAEEEAEGWFRLFDGKTWNGWFLSGRNQEGFIIRDGAMEWAARGGGTIRSRDRYDNFILRLEIRIQEGGNSGVFLRAPRANRSSKIGIEFQIMGDYGAPPGIHSTGAIYSVIAPQVNASRKPWEWNEIELMLDGPLFRATLNGQIVHDLNFDEHDELRHRLRRGFIGFQDHGHPVSIRNVRLKKL